ncbi:MAG: SprT-like domain-containing protein [Oscillospiraceae bacterium]|nr:SprT-like domain-containing protein [Oscillospiraceae bacterium]
MKTIPLPDGREIRYELTRKRVKNVNMRVKSDGIVYVSANTRVSIKRIEEILIERAEFIFRAAEQLKNREERSEITAEKMRWQGKEYPVRVIHNHAERVALEENELRVFTTHPEEAQEMLHKWVGERFAELISELNDEVRGALQAAGLTPTPTRISIKDMKTRWGSCSYTRGHISINMRLMAYPRETVLSVLWHEYAHYWHHDHSARFYAFVERFYPEYRRWNGLLK